MKKALFFVTAVIALSVVAFALVSCSACDFNDDDKVGVTDFTHFSQWYPNYNCSETNGWCEGTDLDTDGDVDVSDFANFGAWYGKTCYSCNDTDGGLVYGAYGEVSGYDDGYDYTYGDYCTDADHIKEYYCNGNHWTFTIYNCTYSNYSNCINGKCV